MSNSAKTDPSHYKEHAMECWDEMEALFSRDEVLAYYKLCVWKYRYRAGNKQGESAETDQAKADVYVKRAASYDARHSGQRQSDEEELLFELLRELARPTAERAKRKLPEITLV